MKKVIHIALIMLMAAGSTGIISCSSNRNKDEMPQLLERTKAIGPDVEKNQIKDTYNKAVAALKEKPSDLQQYINIASAFVMEGRITGNGGYYSDAAVRVLNKVINDPNATKDVVFQALSLKSAVLLNMHQFKDALAVAKLGEAINKDNSGIYGALVDANVELGHYDEAVKDCDRMISIRPDLRSYSRASYLRQIYGENAGARDAMKMAVDAGVPGTESTEWARTTLGDLYLAAGNVDSASIIYRTSLVYRPDYAYALIGMARVEKARKNYDAAITHTKSAIGVLSEAAFVTMLGELYELKGDETRAKEAYSDVVGLLLQGQKEEPMDAVVKHNLNREIAMAYLNAGVLDKALEYAKIDLEMRPDNIDANELAAWIYYRRGEFANAKTHADKMLATKTQQADKLYKAGAIYASAGDAAKGNAMMQDAMTANPYMDPRLVNQVKQPVTIQRQ